MKPSGREPIQLEESILTFEEAFAQFRDVSLRWPFSKYWPRFRGSIWLIRAWLVKNRDSGEQHVWVSSKFALTKLESHDLLASSSLKTTSWFPLTLNTRKKRRGDQRAKERTASKLMILYIFSGKKIEYALKYCVIACREEFCLRYGRNSYDLHREVGVLESGLGRDSMTRIISEHFLE